MATTFTEAREALRAHLANLWGAGADDVAPYGFEDADGYLLVVEEPLVVCGGPSYTVDKLTGTVSEESYLDNVDRIEAMHPVGAAPPALV